MRCARQSLGPARVDAETGNRDRGNNEHDAQLVSIRCTVALYAAVAFGRSAAAAVLKRPNAHMDDCPPARALRSRHSRACAALASTSASSGFETPRQSAPLNCCAGQRTAERTTCCSLLGDALLMLAVPCCVPAAGSAGRTSGCAVAWPAVAGTERYEPKSPACRARHPAALDWSRRAAPPVRHRGLAIADGLGDAVGLQRLLIRGRRRAALTRPGALRAATANQYPSRSKARRAEPGPKKDCQRASGTERQLSIAQLAEPAPISSSSKPPHVAISRSYYQTRPP